MSALAAVAFSLQGLAMAWDEFVCHRDRGLGRWEAWGHAADSAAYAVPLSVAAFAPATPGWRTAFAASAVFSCALITKDEWIHAEECSASEHWIHSLLFVLHPCVLIPVGFDWARGGAPARVLPSVVAAFAVYQAAYWLGFGRARADEPRRVNNDFYGELGELWHDGDSHAVALLRVETKERLRYLRERLPREGVPAGGRILDVGCGGGLVSNALAADGYRVKGVDAAEGALAVARARVPAGAAAEYATADAYALAEPDAAYDAVLLLDVLEHFEEPARAVAEAARALKPGGLLVVHTFNRSFLGWLFAVKGVQFVVRDCPANLHVYRLLVRPEELDAMASRAGLTRSDLRGLRPRVFHGPFWSTVLRRRVHPDFAFVPTASVAAGYLACFRKGGLDVARIAGER